MNVPPLWEVPRVRHPRALPSFIHTIPEARWVILSTFSKHVYRSSFYDISPTQVTGWDHVIVLHASLGPAKVADRWQDKATNWAGRDASKKQPIATHVQKRHQLPPTRVSSRSSDSSQARHPVHIWLLTYQGHSPPNPSAFSWQQGPGRRRRRAWHLHPGACTGADRPASPSAAFHGCPYYPFLFSSRSRVTNHFFLSFVPPRARGARPCGPRQPPGATLAASSRRALPPRERARRREDTLLWRSNMDDEDWADLNFLFSASQSERNTFGIPPFAWASFHPPPPPVSFCSLFRQARYFCGFLT